MVDYKFENIVRVWEIQIITLDNSFMLNQAEYFHLHIFPEKLALIENDKD